MILVIGSSGFAGRHLLKKLEAERVSFKQMNSLDNGILDPKNFENFKNLDIKKVIHLGAKTFVPDSWKQPLDFLESISKGTQNVLDFCVQKKAELIYVSAYVYGTQEKQPIEETRKPQPSNPYAAAKIMAENLCQYYYQYLGVPVHIVRPFNLYGPGQSLKFLIPKILSQALENKGPLELENTMSRRDYVFIDDFINVLYLLTKTPAQGMTYNIGSGQSYSVGEVIQLIEDVLEKKLEIKSLNQFRPNEILDCVADISKLKLDLNWQPEVSLKEGLVRVAQSFGAQIKGRV